LAIFAFSLTFLSYVTWSSFFRSPWFCATTHKRFH